MMKRILPAVSMLLAAACGLPCSCSGERGGSATPVPAVKLLRGTSAPNSVTFTVDYSHADRCAYLCMRAERGVQTPSAAEILSRGVDIAPGAVTVEGLEPLTDYLIAAAASAGALPSEAVTVRMRTAAPLPEPQKPRVTLEAGTAAESSLGFTARLAHAQRAAYLCAPSGAWIGTLTPAAILEQGVPLPASGEVEVTGLRPATTYAIAAVAASGAEVSPIASLEMRTALPQPRPSVDLQPGAAGRDLLSFVATLTDADRGAWLCVERGEDTQLPDAEQILARGAPFTSSGLLEARGLKPSTRYAIVAAAAKGEVQGIRSEIEMTTLPAASSEAMLDRVVRAHYLGKAAGEQYAEWEVVLADAPVESRDGETVPVGEGHAVRLDLWSFAPTPGAGIDLPARTYLCDPAHSLNSFDPAGSYCMARDASGGIVRMRFSGGKITVARSGAQYWLRVEATTEQGDAFTASYQGELPFEDRSPAQEREGVFR